MPPDFQIHAPAIFVPNHHGWFDGYLMFHVVSALRVPTLDWIQEFDAFPLFAKVGGMPYPMNDLKRRAQTVKRTIRLMREANWSLLLFAEAHLHYPPELLSFGRALETIAEKVPDVQIVPVGIQYEMAMHERPEAFISFGPPVPVSPNIRETTQDAVATVLATTANLVRQNKESFQTLVQGTKDVNERLDMRRLRRP